MDPARLKLLTPFAGMSAPALARAASAVRSLRLPAGRWLVRPGRALAEHVYLLQGRVRLASADCTAIVSGGSRRARRPVYPGAAAVATLTPATLALIDPRHFETADEAAAARPDVASALPLVDADTGSWQRRFLASPLLQRLDPPAWQSLLRAMTPQMFEAGTSIVVAGEPGDCCYVMCAGHAEVISGHRAVALLEPGSLFGEDALASESVRNASVVARSRVRVASLSAQPFRRWLLGAVAPPLCGIQGRRLLSLDAAHDGVLHVPPERLRTVAVALPKGQRYAVCGGSAPSRALAALLLAERGIDARPLQD